MNSCRAALASFSSRRSSLLADWLTARDGLEVIAASAVLAGMMKVSRGQVAEGEEAAEYGQVELTMTPEAEDSQVSWSPAVAAIVVATILSSTDFATVPVVVGDAVLSIILSCCSRS